MNCYPRTSISDYLNSRRPPLRTEILGKKNPEIKMMERNHGASVRIDKSS